MTRRYMSAALALLVGTSSVLQAQSPAEVLSVFVAVAPVISDSQTEEQRQAAFADGAKKSKDPAAALANAKLLCGRVDQNELAGSIDDTRKGITGAGLRGRRNHVVLADSAADADLIVELKCRRSARGSGGLFGRQHFVLFGIKPGPKLNADRFAAMPRNDRVGGLLVRAESSTPEWMFEAVGAGSWKVAGSVVASLVDTFAASYLSDSF